MRQASWIVVLAACGGGARIDSRRVEPVAAPLTELVVASEVGANGELAGAAFEAALQQAAAACGVRVMVAPALDPAAPATLAVAFAGSAKDRWGGVRSIHYRATVQAAQRVRWQAELALTVDTRGSTERAAEALARDLMARLGRDQITTPCAKPD